MVGVARHERLDHEGTSYVGRVIAEWLEPPKGGRDQDVVGENLSLLQDLFLSAVGPTTDVGFLAAKLGGTARGGLDLDGVDRQGVSCEGLVHDTQTDEDDDETALVRELEGVGRRVELLFTIDQAWEIGERGKAVIGGIKTDGQFRMAGGR